MNFLTGLTRSDDRIDRVTFQRNVALLAWGRCILDVLALSLAHTTAPFSLVNAWLDPSVLVRPWLNGELPFTMCLTTLIFGGSVVWNSVRRARDAGWSPWLASAAALPYAGIIFLIVLALIPTKRRSVWDLV